MKATLKAVGVAILLCAGATAVAQNLGWKQLPGAANDIGVGPKGDVWVIGNDRAGNDYGIYKLTGGNWTKIPGGAVRIDVGPSGPWVVNSGGGIYRYNGSGWDHIQGGARDIGIGANGTVWVIGGNPEPGGYDIYRFNGSSWGKVGGSAVRIDVDPQGNAWVVTSGNAIYRFNGIQFVQVKGSARDISIGANGVVFIVGTDGGVYRWGGTDWIRHDGVLSDISVDAQGRAYGVNPGKQIFSSTTAFNPTKMPARIVPPPPERTHDGVYVVNNSASFAWITIYKNGKESPYGRTEILGTGCLLPGQHGNWNVLDKIDGRSYDAVSTRVERTKTEDCAPMAGNAHVTCDFYGGPYGKEQARYKNFVFDDQAYGNKPCSVNLRRQ